AAAPVPRTPVRNAALSTDSSLPTMALRVVHLTTVWLPQTQTWIYTQVTGVPSQRIQCEVICERVENLGQFALPRLHRASAPPGVNMLLAACRERLGFRVLWPGVARTARRLEPQVIHSHFGDAAWAHIGVAKSSGAAHIASFYGYDASLLARRTRWRKRLRELFLAVDLILCEGPHMARTLAGLGCPATKLRVHHLGVCLERLAYRPRRWQPGEPLKVLIAATFTEKKGIPFALRALGRLRGRLDLQVTVVGDARDRAEHMEQKREIARAISESGLQDVVRMAGFQSHAEMIREAYAHHLFLSPSVTAASGDTEGGAPVSIAEMAATGMLVISSWHCDIPEMVIDGETGFLAPERDVSGIVECLRRAVGAPDRWPVLLDAARRHIEKEFNASTQGERLAGIYEQAARAS
ncbi:MAG TPA: glycosyltransferase, partial [Burkholderiales bacterium]|nr:glycosyltransferase [Burkholderiales bacterium]